MAIVMVRKPSDTPNVRNIDDIIPFRYAYFNQNGYIKNRGNELNYEINGLNFKVKSGRVVLQGVESEIDANGVTIPIDNLSTRMFYCVYYSVNLALNTTSIEYDYRVGYNPYLDESDDLIANTSGSATLLLYTFEALNGVVSNIQKIVKEINPDEYVKTLEVYNAANSKKINNLDIKMDSNGILRCGNLIIPQQRVLWEGSININNSSGSYVNIGTYTESLKNKRLVIEYKMQKSVYGSTALNKTNVVMVDDYIAEKEWNDREFNSNLGNGYIKFYINTTGSNNYIRGVATFVVEGSNYTTPVNVTRVYEIIE